MQKLDDRVIELGQWKLTGRGTSRRLGLHRGAEVGDGGDRPPTCDWRRRINVSREEMAALLYNGVVRNRAQLAAYLGISRARVTQVLGPQRKGGQK